MKRFLFFILVLVLFRCHSSDSNENVSNSESTLPFKSDSGRVDISIQDILKSRYNLNEIILSDLTTFDKLSKDTLIVVFEMPELCGNAPPLQHIDVRPLFHDIKARAMIFGFKTVFIDSTFLLVEDENRFKRLPHYMLFLYPFEKNKVAIHQYYNYYPFKIQVYKDSIISL